MIQRFLAILSLLVMLWSCSKNKDEEPPKVIITSPTENSSFNVLQSVNVKATIRDNEIIESVSLSLIKGENNAKVLKSKFFSPGSSTYAINDQFKLSDSLLEGGSYYFKVEANDGQNRASDFLYFNLIPIERQRLSILASCESNGTSKIYEVDEQFNVSLTHQYSSKFQASAFNSHDQAFWFLPANSNRLSVYQLKEGTEVFSNQINTSFSQLFTDIDWYGRQMFIAHKEGHVRGYRPNYSSDFLYESNSGRYCTKVEAGSKYVLVEEQSIGGQNKWLNVLYKISGATFTTISISQAIADMEFIDQDHALAIQNIGGDAKLKEISLGSSSKRELLTLNGEIAKKVIKVGEGIFLISTVRSIIRYDYANNVSNEIIQSLNNPVMTYDDLNNSLILAEGDQLKEYNLNNGNLIRTKILPDNVKSLAVRYNRY